MTAPTKLQISRSDACKIHDALHGDAATVQVAGQLLPITVSKTGLRETAIFGVRILQQNPLKNSDHGREARKGAKLTWFMCGNRQWGLIKDGNVEKNCWLFGKDTENSLSEETQDAPTALPTAAAAAAVAATAPISILPQTIKQESGLASRTRKRKTNAEDEDTKPPPPKRQRTSGLEVKAEPVPTSVQDPKTEPFQFPTAADLNKTDQLYGSGDTMPVNVDSLPAKRKSSSNEEIVNTFLIDFREIIIGDRLGAGAFGECRKAKFRGTEVAVKILHSQDDENTALFLKEAALLCKLRHPAVISCIGACVERPNMCIVMELMSSNLSSLIRRGPLQAPLLFSLAKQILQGINYLHKSNPPCIHRDIKPDNILLDSNNNCKLADFGISREKIQTQTMSRIGTPTYCAPEILLSKQYNEKVDMFSFGMVLYSMATGDPPFKGIQPMQVMMKVAVSKERPDLPANCPKAIKDLIEHCWQDDPKLRFSAQQALEYVEKQLPK